MKNSLFQSGNPKAGSALRIVLILLKDICCCSPHANVILSDNKDVSGFVSSAYPGINLLLKLAIPSSRSICFLVFGVWKSASFLCLLQMV